MKIILGKIWTRKKINRTRYKAKQTKDQGTGANHKKVQRYKANSGQKIKVQS
ncbi:hypothetical protein HYD90_03795 [Mycoplasmopsis bovis]|nr:hypothetical protein HYD90_03795 [Mycoplasmopsis bovis]